MRPIDADALKSAFNTDVQNVMLSWDTDLLQLLMIEIDEAPTLDVEPVRHGRWKHLNTPRKSVPITDWLKCTKCNGTLHRLSGVNYNYCPNCGAKMDAKED